MEAVSLVAAENQRQRHRVKQSQLQENHIDVPTILRTMKVTSMNPMKKPKGSQLKGLYPAMRS
jgi:hypothetical protein